jgi:hypothetical protein
MMIMEVKLARFATQTKVREKDLRIYGLVIACPI